VSNQINVAHIQQYANNLGILLQQRGSKLAGSVEVKSYTGKAAKIVEQIGSVVATELLTRHSDTELTDTPHDARWAFPRDFGVADMVDKEDLIRTIIDPTSSYSIAQAYALGRTQDDLIIDAFFTDTAKVGENGSTSITFANDGGTTIPQGSAGMTVDKLREAKKALMANEVDIDNEMLYCAITAQQHDDLLSETQAISLDYSTRPVLMDGRITAFMGFNFVHCERLGLDGSGDQECPAWAKSGMCLGTWNGVESSVDRIPTKWNNMMVQSKGTWGATRTEGKKIVKIVCDVP
jgi:hypothetical protein